MINSLVNYFIPYGDKLLGEASNSLPSKKILNRKTALANRILKDVQAGKKPTHFVQLAERLQANVKMQEAEIAFAKANYVFDQVGKLSSLASLTLPEAEVPLATISFFGNAHSFIMYTLPSVDNAKKLFRVLFLPAASIIALTNLKG